MAPVKHKPFCGICLADIDGPPKKQPLGRAGGLVNICDACDTQVISEPRPPFLNIPSWITKRKVTP